MKNVIIKVASFVISLILILPFCTGESAKADSSENEYRPIMEEHFSPYFNYEESPSGSLYFFGMDTAYKHYGNGTASDETETPEYVVVFIDCTATRNRITYEIGDYFIYGYDPPILDTELTYYVIDMKSGDVTPLLEALEADYDKYYAFLENCNYDRIFRRGDANQDGVLDIKDATHLQKWLVGLAEIDYFREDMWGFSEKKNGKWGRYVSDMNEDGVRNIRDATAIQKTIAGIL